MIPDYQIEKVYHPENFNPQIDECKYGKCECKIAHDICEKCLEYLCSYCGYKIKEKKYCNECLP